MGIQTKGRGIQTVKGAYQTEGEGVAKKMKKLRAAPPVARYRRLAGCGMTIGWHEQKRNVEPVWHALARYGVPSVLLICRRHSESAEFF